MIIDLYMTMEDKQGMNISYSFKNYSDKTLVAEASDNYNEYITLKYLEKYYEFRNLPKLIEKSDINIKYPLSSKVKKTIGFYILENGECIAKFYGEAATCRKKGIFKRNIGFTVFEYNNIPYVLYRVGFKNENSHYYCLYDNNNSTVAIIERHSFQEDNRKATLYIEKEENITIALLVCTEEMISIANSSNRDGLMDPSAGHYISLLEEEQDMFDQSFIDRVKAEELSNR